MIVERSTFQAKPGCMRELVELLLAERVAERERSKDAPPFRCYTSVIGQDDQLALEWEFENLAERDKYWDEWLARETPGFHEKYHELTTGGGKREIWELEE